MKRLSLLILLVVGGVSQAAQVQDGGQDLCQPFIPLEAGTSLTYHEYDAKDKLTSTQVMTVENVLENAQEIIVSLHMKMHDEKENEDSEANFEYSCEDGVFKMSMESFMTPNAEMENMEGMEIKVEQENLAYPNGLEVGQTLPDASIKVEFVMSGMSVMTTHTTISERKVEAKETVVTDAGSFECIKISYTSTSKMGFSNITAKAIEWISPNIGIVRSESYNKNDKLEGYRVLQAITKG